VGIREAKDSFGVAFGRSRECEASDRAGRSVVGSCSYRRIDVNMNKWVVWSGALVFVASGCRGSDPGADFGSGGTAADASTGEDEPVDSTTASSTTTDPDSEGDVDTDDGATSIEEPKYDVGAPDSDTDSDIPGGDGGCFPSEDDCDCGFEAHVPCDDGTQDLFEAIGLNCPGEPTVTTSVMGSPLSRELRSSFGGTDMFDPREGSVYAVLSSGDVSELDTSQFGPPIGPAWCNTDLGDEWNMGASLPAPIQTNDVGAVDCNADPSLVGTGDCSNTIEEQFSAGGSANDYAEMRIEATVPADVSAFRFDFAFFSVEYPHYTNSAFNDLFIGWLESENWTGNISFDGAGNPISISAGFFALTGNIPEFQNTCMRGHGGTGWLRTTASVSPGEDITVVLAIFDLSDSILDSVVFIDNWEWGCMGDDSGPSTVPAG
jgi:hypothetical protein